MGVDMTIHNHPFTDENTETQDEHATCPDSHSRRVAEVGCVDREEGTLCA